MFSPFKRRPEPKVTPEDRTPSARDQARALLSMLEAGGTPEAKSIPPERLRDLARDVIARVEQNGKGPSRAAPPAPAALAPETPAFRAPSATPRPTPKLFRTPDPFGVSKPAPEPSAAPDLPAPISTPLAAKAPQRPEPRPRWRRDRAAVEQLVATAFRAEDAVSEHPVILALDLAGRAPRDQAARLRQVPPGRVRSTHRFLMELERSRS